MTRRAVIGARSGATNGIFVSPAGVDAYYATNDQLLLNISSKVQQLILIGAVGSNQEIALGLSRSPFVFITSRETMTDLVGVGGAISGQIRPSPSGLKRGVEQDGGISFVSTTPAYAAIYGSGTYMIIHTDRPTCYAVYNAPLT